MINCIYYGVFLLQGINIIFLLWKDTTNDLMLYIICLMTYGLVSFCFIKFAKSLYLYIKKEE
jgi:uncharacterized membrane protein